MDLWPGERLAFQFFDELLPLEWEIYLQPYLNGLKPDIVLLNPKVGIAIFEVKDWNLEGEPPKKASDWQRLAARQGRKRGLNQSPLDQVIGYEREIRELYCPRLNTASGVAAISAGVIITGASTEKAVAFLKPGTHQLGAKARYHPISGRDALDGRRLDVVFPEGLRTQSNVMSEDLADDLRNWLGEAATAEERRTPPPLTAQQKILVQQRTERGYRRVKGPAGSGKSVAIAGRAAQLWSEGKEVLVVTFNITLIHYLHAQIRRWPRPLHRRGGVTILSFHEWAKRVCVEGGRNDEYRRLWTRDNEDEFDLEAVLDESMAQVVQRALKERPEEDLYDAVLLDEGQDFRQEWWACLRQACKPQGEMMLVADATQDLYSRAHVWTEESMPGAGFHGPWFTLDGSHRLPQRAADVARAFANEFLEGEIDPPAIRQQELEVYPCSVRWQTVPEAKLADACVDAFRRMVVEAGPRGLSVADVVFLASDKELGRQVLAVLSGKGLRVRSTFDEDSRKGRVEKLGFYANSAFSRATTVHSFKGFESRALVVAIRNARTQKAKAAIYVALTRLLRHPNGSFLAVVSSERALEEFGKRFDTQEPVG